MQLVFGRDSILNVAHTANWKLIQAHKQRQIRQNNIWENRKHNPYQYKVGKQLLIKQDQQAKYMPIFRTEDHTLWLQSTIMERSELTWLLSAIHTTYVRYIRIGAKTHHNGTVNHGGVYAMHSACFITSLFYLEKYLYTINKIVWTAVKPLQAFYVSKDKTCMTVFSWS